jgi:hypothetical protein
MSDVRGEDAVVAIEGSRRVDMTGEWCTSLDFGDGRNTIAPRDVDWGRTLTVDQLNQERSEVAKKRQRTNKPVDEVKRAEKRKRRDERKAAEAQAKQQAARRRQLKTALIVVAGIAAVVVVGVLLYPRLVPQELPGVIAPRNEGRTHVASDESVDYATATPTSGPHSAGAPRCGVLDQQLPPELAVHALEHGSVVIWYQPELGGDEVGELRAIVGRFDDRVILSPNGQLDQPIVATAWNRLKPYEPGDPELEEFIETYRGRGPESVRCAY